MRGPDGPVPHPKREATVFSGCNIVYHDAASGHRLETTASGTQSGLLTRGVMA